VDNKRATDIGVNLRNLKTMPDGFKIKSNLMEYMSTPQDSKRSGTQ